MTVSLGGTAAAAALGKQQRDRLIQFVTEYLGEVVIMFTNGRRLA
jgi:hypothetical protein